MLRPHEYDEQNVTYLGTVLIDNDDFLGDMLNYMRETLDRQEMTTVRFGKPMLVGMGGVLIILGLCFQFYLYLWGCPKIVDFKIPWLRK